MGRGQRNDRPPRFQRDNDFPKPGTTDFNPIQSTVQGQPQRWNDSDRRGRGAGLGPRLGSGDEQWRDERRDLKVGQLNSISSGNTRSRIQQGQFGNHQISKRDRVLRENEPAGQSDLPPFWKKQANGPLGPKNSDPAVTDRPEPHSKRKGKMERPNSATFDGNQGTSGQSNVVHLTGGKDPSNIQDDRPAHSNKNSANVNACFQNGDLEPKRTGPIKPQSSGPGQKSNGSYNSASKKRSGPIKSYRGSEMEQPAGSSSHANWKPGDQCLALYWEDNKVSDRQLWN